MALRTMREIGDAILHKRSKELKKISRRDLHLIEDMLDTMYDREGVGLAAPQIGVLKRIVVIHGGIIDMNISQGQENSLGEDSLTSRKERIYGENSSGQDKESQKNSGETIRTVDSLEEIADVDPIILINPIIIKAEGSQTGEEACLSVPGRWGMVTRPEKVTVKAVDANMEEFELEGEGLLARAICHEIDHLDGKLYVDLVEGELRDADDRDEEESK